MASQKRHGSIDGHETMEVSDLNTDKLSNRSVVVLRTPSIHTTAAEARRSKTTVIVAGAAYCAASVTMVLVNKLALSSFNFTSPTGLLWFQCFVCVVLVWVCEGLQFIRRQRLTMEIMKIWLPVNILFVLMIVRRCGGGGGGVKGHHGCC